MASKRTNKWHGGRRISQGTRSNSMALRSRSLKRRHDDQEASSRVMPLRTPAKRKDKNSKRCIFIDDEVQVEEDSNVVLNESHDSEIRGRLSYPKIIIIVHLPYVNLILLNLL